jgi:hypothetical protein
MNKKITLIIISCVVVVAVIMTTHQANYIINIETLENIEKEIQHFAVDEFVMPQVDNHKPNSPSDPDTCWICG